MTAQDWVESGCIALLLLCALVVRLCYWSKPTEGALLLQDRMSEGLTGSSPERKAIGPTVTTSLTAGGPQHPLPDSGALGQRRANVKQPSVEAEVPTGVGTSNVTPIPLF